MLNFFGIGTLAWYVIVGIQNSFQYLDISCCHLDKEQWVVNKEQVVKVHARSSYSYILNLIIFHCRHNLPW